MDWNPQEWLKTQHTKQLMGIRDSIYRVFGGHNSTRTGYRTSDEDEMSYDPFDSKMFYVTLAQVKAELATREHVPNKKEAKAIRQQRAKERK